VKRYLLLHLPLQLDRIRPLRIIQSQLLFQLLQDALLLLLTHLNRARIGYLQTELVQALGHKRFRHLFWD
jgi:hypothetical protein